MPYSNALFFRRYNGGAGASSCPTVLLHGLGGSHLSWPPAIRRLPGHIVYALDLPGHGKSDHSTCVEVECHTTALYRFIHNLGVGKVNLVGHSMGAMVALAFSSLYPKLLNKLSLLSMGEIYPFNELLEQYFSHEKTKEQAIKILLDEGFHAGYAKDLRKQLLDPLYKTRISLLHADAQIGMNFNAHEYVNDLRFPIQLATGKDDALVPLAGVNNLADRIPHAELTVIENCGHFMMHEKTEIARDHLLRFITQDGWD